jgi:putative membrane protein
MNLKPLAARIAGALLVTSAFSLPAIAADEQSQSQHQSAQGAGATGAHSQLSQSDRKFLMDAAQGGMMEVEAARLAMDHAVSADVKTFAQTLLRDHQAANEKLQRIAADKGVTLPKELDAKHKEELRKLSDAKGESFDRMFMQRMGLHDHKKDISEFEKQAKQGKDAQLKSFAEQTLPTLQKHLSMAEKISGSGASAEASGKDKEAAGSKQ